MNNNVDYLNPPDEIQVMIEKFWEAVDYAKNLYTERRLDMAIYAIAKHLPNDPANSYIDGILAKASFDNGYQTKDLNQFLTDRLAKFSEEEKSLVVKYLQLPIQGDNTKTLIKHAYDIIRNEFVNEPPKILHF